MHSCGGDLILPGVTRKTYPETEVSFNVKNDFKFERGLGFTE